MPYIYKTEKNRSKYLVKLYGYGYKHKWTFNKKEATVFNSLVVNGVAKAVKRYTNCKLTVE